jgi:hypothetical protein
MQDILFDVEKGNARRLVFYPYSNCSGVKVILTNVIPSQVGDGGKWSVKVVPSNNTEQEQVETWNNVFNIEERYAEIVAEEAENWIVEFIYQANLPKQDEDVNAWREAFSAWSKKLSKIKEHRVVRNGILKQAYFEYLYREASHPVVIGIKSMAKSDMFSA